MPCEHYKDALTEAAASSEAPSGGLRDHLDACAACRVAFAEEQQLFAAIDCGVRATANAEVPPSLIPAVRARLDENTAPRRRWILAPAMLACAAVLLISFVVVRARRQVGPQRVEAPIQNASKLAPPKVVPPKDRISVKMTPATAVGATHHHAPATQVTRVEEPVVLVPAGQREMVDLLVASMRRGEIKGDVLRADDKDPRPQPLPIAPIGIVPIEIKPLEIAAMELR